MSSSWLIRALCKWKVLDTVLATLGCSRQRLKNSLILAMSVSMVVLRSSNLRAWWASRCRRHKWFSCTLWLADHWCTSWRESVPVQILVAGHSSASSMNCWCHPCGHEIDVVPSAVQWHWRPNMAELWIVLLTDLCATQCRLQQSSPVDMPIVVSCLESGWTILLYRLSE